MKQFWLGVACSILLSTHAVAGVLNAQEVARVKSDIATMLEAFEKGDAAPLIARTHESIYGVMGGKEQFEKTSKKAVDQMMQSGIKFLDSEVGTPTKTYPAGEEEVCFVPRISVFEILGKKAKSTGFMIAIRRIGGDSWKYLDAAGLRKNPEYLKLLLPKLESGIELPPNKVEIL